MITWSIWSWRPTSRICTTKSTTQSSTANMIKSTAGRSRTAEHHHAERWHMKQWGWVIQYGVAMLLAVLLGAILGSFPLFHQTALGETKLKASHLVEFIGYGGALLMFWLLARRLYAYITHGTPVSIQSHVIVMLETLFVPYAGSHELLLSGVHI